MMDTNSLVIITLQAIITGKVIYYLLCAPLRDTLPVFD